MDCTLEIQSLAFGGEGVGRLESGRICFVRGVLPGELVRIEIVHEYKGFSRGRLLEILRPAPERVEPLCPFFDQCPGCAYQHTDYETELKWKQVQFEGFIRRNSRFEIGEILPPFPAPSRVGYRNKLTFHCVDSAFCYLGYDNQSPVKVGDCMLGNAALRAGVRETAPNESGQITFRWTRYNGFQCTSRKNAPELTERLRSFGTFRVPAKSFFQVNNDVADELVKRVAGLVAESGARTLLELYCGVGVFSIACAKTIPEILCTGIEIDRNAIKVATKNAKFHTMDDRCRFFANDAEKSFARLVARCNPESTCVLVDPPRGGLKKELAEKMASSNVAAILYISCSPDTLRRDLDIICAGGYGVASTGLMDMFPSTPHFESVTLLRRR